MRAESQEDLNTIASGESLVPSDHVVEGVGGGVDLLILNAAR